MSVEAIGAVPIEGMPAIGSVGSLNGAQTPIGENDFSHWMAAQIGETNAQINTAQAGLAQLATGESGNLHGVMLELQKAKLEFQLTLQIRNKVLEGYQDIMRMQI